MATEPRGDAHLDALLFALAGGGAAAFASDNEDDDVDGAELAPLVELVSCDDGSEHLPAPPVANDLFQQQQQSHRHHIKQQQQVVERKPPAPRNARCGAKKEPRSRSNKARDERRSELIYLRKKSSELEAQLRNFRARQQAERVDGSDHAANCAVVRKTPASAEDEQSMWQGIATRQSEERAKAERENIRLKLVLENQLKIAKGLEKMLHKKAAAKDMDQFTERVFTPSLASNATGEDVFDIILKDVERMYFEIDTVFEANGLAHTEAPLSNAFVRSSVESGTVVEVFANKVLPFDMHATGSAVWHHFAFARDRTPFRNYKFDSSKFLHSMKDTIMESFNLKLDAKGTRAIMRVKQILRRHVEEDRIVILWRAPFEAVEYSDEPVPSMPFVESGYIVIKRPSTLTENHTLLQTCYITTTDFADELLSNFHLPVGAITDFVLAATATNVSSTHQIIENVLVEQALSKRTQGAAAIEL